MAIYHLHAKIVQRSKGKNAVAAAAYRRAAKLFDEKEAKTWNYANKSGVIHTEITVPNDCPAWVQALVNLHETNSASAAEKLWNLVEASEKRIDSQLAREIEFALPIELDHEQNINLAREFIHDQFALRGMIADWSVHWDEGNPHVHVMLTMRDLAEEGFGKRVLAWNSKALLLEWRQKWAEYANFHLRLHQQNVNIDHRSYQEQGIDLIPTIHQGKAISDMDRRGITTQIMGEANDIRRENLSRISAKPDILLTKLTKQSETFTDLQLGQELGRYINDQGKFQLRDKKRTTTVALNENHLLETGMPPGSVLTPAIIANILNSIEHHESVFTEKSLAKAINPYTHNAEAFAKALMQIKCSKELLYLGPGEDGRERFTTRKMFQLENNIQDLADTLGSRHHVKISAKEISHSLKIYQHTTGKNLTSEQTAAIKHILKPTSVSCLVGRAGTGKSFSLAAAKAVWESKGLRVHGVALSGIAADGLAKDAGIQSRTIDSFRYAIQQSSLILNHHDVIVMDEAGMTDSIAMEAMLKAVQEARAKLVLVGDHAQLQPVGPGASFRALLERLNFAEIQTVYRQQSQWQRDATAHLSCGRVANAVTAYKNKNCLHLLNTEQDAMSALVNAWAKARIDQPKHESQFLVIAHRNKDVNQLNSLLRSERITRSEIYEGYTVTAKDGQIKLAEGDRILFLKNDRRLGVSNGRFATIKSVNFTESGNIINFVAILDGQNKEICIDPREYRDFAYGYAATVHKVQGMTIDHSFVYAGGVSWNRHLTYVALTRHRESCNLYASYDVHQDQKTLLSRLSRLGQKDSLLDFPLEFSERRGIDTSHLSKILPKHLTQRLKDLKEIIINKIDQIINPDQYAKRLIQTNQAKQELEKVIQRREDAKLVASYVNLNREVGMTWQALNIKLNEMGFTRMDYRQGSFEQISSTKEYSVFQSALKTRNQVSFQIVKELSRYEKAIEIYGIDTDKLKKQAGRYNSQTLTPVDKSRQKAAEIHQKMIVTKNKATTFESLLTHYVDLELEQTRIISELYVTRLKDPQSARELSSKSIAHAEDIKNFATEAIQNPEIKAGLENLTIIKQVSLAKRGGFIAIQERISKGQWLKEDTQALLTHLRNKVSNQSRSQTRDRDREGRSR